MSVENLVENNNFTAKAKTWQNMVCKPKNWRFQDFKVLIFSNDFHLPAMKENNPKKGPYTSRQEVAKVVDQTLNGSKVDVLISEWMGCSR